MCDWRKLPRRVTSRPEIEISDKRLAFSSQTSSIEPSYKTGPKQVKMSISPIAQGFLKIFRVQNVALTVRRPKAVFDPHGLCVKNIMRPGRVDWSLSDLVSRN